MASSEKERKAMSYIPTRVRGKDKQSTLELTRLGDSVVITIRYDGKPKTTSMSVDLVLLAQAIERETKA